MIGRILIFIIIISVSSFQYAMEQPPKDEFAHISEKQKKIIFKYIYKGWDNFFKRELDKGVPLEIRDDIGCTLLQAACSASKFDIVALLIARGANIQGTSGYFSSSCLSYAITSNPDAPRVVELLLAHGADAASRGYDNTTPLFLAAVGGYVPLVVLMLTKARFNADHRITEDDDLEEAVRLFTNFRIMEAKKLLCMKDRNTFTPLSMVKIQLEVMCKKDGALQKYEVERKRGFGELIPLLTIDFFEDNFRTAIQEDVRKVLISLRKKRQ